MARELTSVGIDIGTTTTQMAVSRLTLENTAPFGGLPRVEITSKRVVHLSPIAFTPLRDASHIDTDRLADLIASFYRGAGISADDVDTGAAIVTGETARAENARAAVEAVSRAGGDFVVAAAGPDLEALLAGAGAGARELSRTGGRVLTFDVGGGTTNAALFEDGRARDRFALDVGGRLVRAEAGRISFVSPRLAPVLRAIGSDMAPGDGLAGRAGDVLRLCRALARVLARIARGGELGPSERGLWIGHEAARGADLLPARVMFSGGVAEFVYPDPAPGEPDVAAAFARFGDMGPLLGRAIREEFDAAGITVAAAAERSRATVIGAGSHATTLSGSTVFADASRLPRKNVPVLDLFPGAEEDYSALAGRARAEAALFPDGRGALFFRGPERASRADIVLMADQLSQVLEEGDLVLVEHDFAKALGQQLASLGVRGVIVLDGISLARGDYIDVGRPVEGAVPVVVKTLVCPGSAAAGARHM